MDVVEERAFSLESAERRIDDFIEKQGLVCRLEYHGAAWGVHLARLYDADAELAFGAGKGDAASSRVGAKYEAVEHWLTQHDAYAQSRLVPASDVLAQDGADHAPLSLLRLQPDARLLCRSFVNVRDGTRFVSPLGLFLPGYDEAALPMDSFDYRGLRRYSSNSGTAIGANGEEALLHALNECIERDAISLFLLRYFYYERDDVLKRVDPARLDPGNRSLYEHLEEVSGAEIVLLDISTEFGVTTCLAFFRTRYEGPHVHGAGASLNPHHAVYRALAELLQAHLVEGLGLVRDQSARAMRVLGSYPALSRAQMFDVDKLMSVPACWVALEQSGPMGLKQQIDRIARSLAACGFRVGACRLRDDDVALTCVTVPGFERFFIISSGNIVLPGRRGSQLKGLAA